MSCSSAARRSVNSSAPAMPITLAAVTAIVATFCECRDVYGTLRIDHRRKRLGHRVELILVAEQ